MLRAFPSGDWLLYNAAGELIKYETPGDWTSDGFVLVEAVHISGDRLQVDGRRLLAVATDKGFRLRPAEQPGPEKNQVEPSRVRIEAHFGPGAPLPEPANAALARIFFTETDDLASLVPVYWRSCVSSGLLGKNQNCRFSPEMSAVPGVTSTRAQAVRSITPAPSSPGQTTSPRLDDLEETLTEHPFRLGSGVTPPKVLYSPEPEFTNAARGVRYQGVVALGVVVDKDGVLPRRYGFLVHWEQAWMPKLLTQSGRGSFSPRTKMGIRFRLKSRSRLTSIFFESRQESEAENSITNTSSAPQSPCPAHRLKPLER